MLDVARLLAGGTTPEARRRAISTTYYALFHCLAAHAADRFVGRGDATPAYAMFYRSLDHAEYASSSSNSGKSNVRPSFRKVLGRATSSVALRRFADVFVERRQLADYDPFMAVPSQQEIESLIDEAAGAVQAFFDLDPVERTEMLALMIAGVRS